MEPASPSAPPEPLGRSAREPGAIPELAGLQRPRLRPEIPILWRTSTSVQLGDRLVIPSVSRALVAWMTSLDGTSNTRTIIESLTIPEAEARRLVRAMLAAGALDDAARIPASVRWAPAAERPSAAGRFAATVAAYQDAHVAHSADAHRGRMRIGVLGESPLATRVRSCLGDAGLLRGDGRPDLTVLADSHHPDVPADFDHPAMTRPHMYVATHAERAVIGPLVVPGRTGCLRCRHLHRRDADPAWPVVAVQWAHALANLTSLPTDPLLAGMAAHWAALLVRAWVDLPDEPALWGGWCLDISLPLGDPQPRECPPHPLCGCRWDLRLESLDSIA